MKVGYAQGVGKSDVGGEAKGVKKLAFEVEEASSEGDICTLGKVVGGWIVGRRLVGGVEKNGRGGEKVGVHICDAAQ